MDNDFVNLTLDNLAKEHLCCIIRSKKPHSGVEAKRQWLTERLAEGHVFRKLDDKSCVFIEYSFAHARITDSRTWALFGEIA